MHGGLTRRLTELQLRGASAGNATAANQMSATDIVLQGLNPWGDGVEGFNDAIFRFPTCVRFHIIRNARRENVGKISVVHGF